MAGYYKTITINASEVTGTHANFPVYLNLGADSDMAANVSYLDGRDIYITDTSNVLLDYELVPDGQYLAHDGAWTWFNSPIAYDDGTNIYVGWISSRGHVFIGQYATASGTWDSTRITAASIEVDDHNNPAIAIASDGKIIAGYCRHNADNVLRYRISSTAGDATSWAAEQTMSLTGVTLASYAALERLSTEGTGSGRIYWFFRSDTTGWDYVYTDDDGANWTNSAPQNWWAGTGTAYVKVFGNGSDRIDFLVTDAHPNQANKVIYHFYYYSGTWYNANGTAITENNDGSTPLSLPIDSGDLNSSSTVFSDASDTAWVWDIYYDGTNAHALYTTFPSDVSTNHDYHYAKLSGGSWSSVKLCDAGSYLYATEGYYSGGLCFAPSDATTIYLCKEEGGTPKYELQKWVTTDSGSTWSKTTSNPASNDGDITTGSTHDNFRPFAVRGAGTSDNIQIIWNGSGTYTAYTNFATALRAYPGMQKRWEHAWVEVADTIGSGDVAIRVHYGDSTQTDQQNASGVWDANYSFVCHGHRSLNDAQTFPDSTSNGNDATFVTSTASADEGIMPYTSGIRIPIFSTAKPDGVNDEYLDWASQVNLAGAQALCAETWFNWDPAGADENCLLNNWSNATSGNILWRLEPSGNAIEAFVARQANTQEGGTIGALAASQDAWHYGAMLFDYDAAANADIICRVDQAEATYTCTSSAALDSDTSGDMQWGRGTYNGDELRGYGSEIRLTVGALRTKDHTDTHYDNITSYATFLTFGTETAEGGAFGGASNVIGGGIFA